MPPDDSPFGRLRERINGSKAERRAQIAELHRNSPPVASELTPEERRKLMRSGGFIGPSLPSRPFPGRPKLSVVPR